MATATPPLVYAVKQISYAVPSHSTPGTFHTVQVNPTTRRPTSCDCPARRECWHMKAVASGTLNLKPRMRVGLVEQTVEQLLAAERERRAAYADAGSRAVAAVSDLYGD
jgi:hypothetical protein